MTLTEDDSLRLWGANTGRSWGKSIDRVSDADFSPDSRVVVTLGDDGTARVWKTDSGEPVGEPMPHPDKASSVKFLAGGNTVLTRSKSTARLWDAASGKPIGEPFPCVALAVSADRRVIFAGGENGAQLWDAATGKPIGNAIAPGKSVVSVAISPDGKTILTAAGGSGTIRLWDATTGRQHGESMDHSTGAPDTTDIEFIAQGKVLLIRTPDGELRLWDTTSGLRIGDLHNQKVRTALFSPDGKRIVTGIDDGIARLWDAATGRPLGEPMLHLREVSTVAFSSDGAIALTIDGDNTARLWCAATGKPIGEPIPKTFLFINDDGRLIPTYEVSQLLANPTGQKIAELMRRQGWFAGNPFHPDGKLLVTRGGERGQSVQLRAGDDAAPIGSAMPHPDQVRTATFSPDGKTVLTQTGHGTVRLWNPSLRPSMRHRGKAQTLNFSPDGKAVLLSTGDDDKRETIYQLLDASTDQPLGPPLVADYHRVRRFSPDHKTAILEVEDGEALGPTLRLWSMTKGTFLGEPIPNHKYAMTPSPEFQPDGKRVLIISYDDWTARLLDTTTGEPVGKPIQLPDDHAVVSLDLSPDAKTTLLTFDVSAQLWDLETGKPVGKPMLHEGLLFARFGPDGKTIWTLDARAFHLWDASTGAPIGEAIPRVQHARFSPDGRVVLTLDKDNRAQLRDARTGRPIGPPSQPGSSLPRHSPLVFFHPSAKAVWTIDTDDVARLWDTTTGLRIGEPMKLDGKISDATLRSDGKKILTSTEDGTVRVWDTATRQPDGKAFHHQGAIVSAAFGPDGKAILIHTKEGSVSLWDPATGYPIGGPLQRLSGVSDLAVRPDGQAIWTRCQDGTDQLWSVPAPLEGRVEQIDLWVQLTTNEQLDSEDGVRQLDAATWNQRRHDLERLGGPPRLIDPAATTPPP
jgi:WD40 repeat protein